MCKCVNVQMIDSLHHISILAHWHISILKKASCFKCQDNSFATPALPGSAYEGIISASATAVAPLPNELTIRLSVAKLQTFM